MSESEKYVCDPVSAWFQPVLEFANMKLADHIADAQQVALTDLLGGESVVVGGRVGRLFVLSTHLVAWSTPQEPRLEQKRLQRYLERIVQGEVLDLSADFNQMAKCSDPVATLFHSERAGIEVITGVVPKELQHWYTMALVFLSEFSGVTVNRCQLQRCNSFFLGTRRKKYCQPGHGSQVRVKRKRKRDQRRAMG